MSELKDYSILDIEAIDDERYKTESAPGKWVPESRVYLKSEADAVIAEKDKEIADLVEKNKRLAHKDLIMASETIKDVFKELRHQKYKRCLDKAKWCHDKYNCFYNPFYKAYYPRWEKRWIDLADKFADKEA